MLPGREFYLICWLRGLAGTIFTLFPWRQRVLMVKSPSTSAMTMWPCRGGEGGGHQDDVAIVDVGLGHGVPFHPQKEGGFRPEDDVLIDV